MTWAPVIFIHDVVRAAPGDRVEAWFGKGAADLAFEVLDGELPWHRVGDRPRDEVYFNDAPAPYTYGSGRGRTTYAPLTTWHSMVLRIRQQLEADLFKLCGKRWIMDACFLNRYRDGKDHLGWHADDSPEMDPDRPVVSVSLGARRELWVRPWQAGVPAEVQVFELVHGDALVMLPGMQRSWQHRVPKADRPVGPRISLTFRGYLPPKAAT